MKNKQNKNKIATKKQHQKNPQQQQQQPTKKQQKKPSGFNENAQRSEYDRMTGVKNVRSFLSSYLEKDNSLGGHHLLVGEWPTLVTKFCACFAIRRASAEFHCSLHLKIKSIKYLSQPLLLVRCILSLSQAF